MRQTIKRILLDELAPGLNDLIFLKKKGYLEIWAGAVATKIEEEVGDWISVEDRFPDHSNEVLTYVPDYFLDNKVLIGHYYKETEKHPATFHAKCQVSGETLYDYVVTHWQPLPQLPKTK